MTIEELAQQVFEYIRVEKIPPKVAAEKLLADQIKDSNKIESISDVLEEYKNTHTGLEPLAKKILELMASVQPNSSKVSWEDIKVSFYYTIYYTPVQAVLAPWDKPFSMVVQVARFTDYGNSVVLYFTEKINGLDSQEVYGEKSDYNKCWYLEERR